jgi:hypothetical protein
MKSISRLACDAGTSILRDSLKVFDFRSAAPHVLLVTSSAAASCELSSALAAGYRDSLTQHASLVTYSELVFKPDTFLDDVRGALLSNDRTPSSPLVACVVVQPSAFQNELKKYRLRLNLFEMGLRVAEHGHLSSMRSEAEIRHYLASCSFVGKEARAACESVMRFIEPCTREPNAAGLAVLCRDGSRLEYSGPLERPLSNDGCYDSAIDCDAARFFERQRSALAQPTGTAGASLASVGLSVGGSFPMGEVITESVDLGCVNGQASFFAYPNTDKKVCVAKEPFQLTIEKGIVTRTSSNTPPEVLELLDLVRSVDKEAYIRELGIGVNPHLGPQALLSDVTAFERQWGVHVSLGKRHPLFVKKASRCHVGPALRRKDGVFHIDLFLDAARIEVGSARLEFTSGQVPL